MKVLKFYPSWKGNSPKAICDDGICYEWLRKSCKWVRWGFSEDAIYVLEYGYNGRPTYYPVGTMKLKGLQ